MINFPIEVGVLGWASTIVFWAAVGVVLYGVIKIIHRDNSDDKLQ